MTLVGFQFLVSENEVTRWAFIQGNGGRFGDECLHAYAEAEPGDIRLLRTVCKVLGQVRRELDKEGFLREFVDGDVPADRIRRITPEKIDGAKAVWA